MAIPNKNTRLYLSPPHVGDAEKQYVAEAFATNWIAPLGPHVDAFERELAAYAGVSSVAALTSGTAAIHLALKLCGVSAGDEVFCSSLTFSASANPIVYQGAIPVFIDSDPTSWNMSFIALKNAFAVAVKRRKQPKAVIVVNLYGQSADMEPILELCNEYGVPVIEDAAESLGATYQGKSSGTFGKYGIYSFNGNKIITTSGGGALISNDEAGMAKARFWATQARDPARHYQHSEIGYNYRMSNVLAGIGRGQLQSLDRRVSARRRIFDRYVVALGDITGFEFMPEAFYGKCNRWLTTLTVNPAECGVTCIDIMDALEQENIESRPVWKPMHLQPVFEDCRYYPHQDGTSISDGLFENGICLPSGTAMTETEQDRVIGIIRDLISQRKRHG